METRKRAKDKPDEQTKLINHERSIFIQGYLNEDLVFHLTAKILSLRKNSRSPITVFIDSPGGSIAAAEIIRGLLKTPDQMGRTCWINTVVTGQACSAAADLLTSGDYIISYPNAYIHFHGIRTRKEEITAEEAGFVEEELLSENKSAALRHAATVFDRMLLNYFKVRPELPYIRKIFGQQLDNFSVLLGDGTIDVPAFAFCLSDKVNDPYKEMLKGCLQKTNQMSTIVKKFEEEAENQRELPPIVRAALKTIGKEEESETKKMLSQELILLNLLLASKIRENPNWRLTTEDFDKLEQDFHQLNTMLSVEDEAIDRFLKFADWLMSPRDRAFFQRYTYEDTANPKINARFDEIFDRAYTKIEALWSFSLSLCRALTVGENPISPVDAWWLGLIDEVLGSPSLTRRTIRTKVKTRLITKIPVADFDRLVDSQDT